MKNFIHMEMNLWLVEVPPYTIEFCILLIVSSFISLNNNQSIGMTDNDTVPASSCLSCVRSGHCELQELARELGVEDEGYYDGETTPSEIDTSAAHMIRDNSKCILCRRCVAVCSEVQGIGVIGANNRDFATEIGSAFGMGLGETSCVSCGQCIAVCPTGALQEKDCTSEVFAAIADPSKHVIVQTAPAVRADGKAEFFA